MKILRSVYLFAAALSLGGCWYTHVTGQLAPMPKLEPRERAEVVHTMPANAQELEHLTVSGNGYVGCGGCEEMLAKKAGAVGASHVYTMAGACSSFPIFKGPECSGVALLVSAAAP